MILCHCIAFSEEIIYPGSLNYSTFHILIFIQLAFRAILAAKENHKTTGATQLNLPIAVRQLSSSVQSH